MPKSLVGCLLSSLVINLLLFINVALSLVVVQATGPSPALSRKLPQALIIGAKKCGTRALLKFIGAHYNVSAAGAEVHFFDRFYHLGTEWYRQQMPLSSEFQITIEKTPKYLVDKDVPQRVHRLNPNMKLIVVLRNPIVRAISEYVQSQTKKKRFASRSLLESDAVRFATDSKRFQSMLYEERVDSNQTLKRTIRSEWPIIRNGLYYQHIKQWLKYFPIEQFVFINGEQLIKEPSAELDKLQEFLNLKKVIRKEHFVNDKRKGFPCIIKPLDSTQIKCLSEEKGRKHPIIDNFILNDLQNYYQPHNTKLFELIQQRPWWV